MACRYCSGIPCSPGCPLNDDDPLLYPFPAQGAHGSGETADDALITLVERERDIRRHLQREVMPTRRVFLIAALMAGASFDVVGFACIGLGYLGPVTAGPNLLIFVLLAVAWPVLLSAAVILDHG
jgi:hypothetical protein